MVFQLVGSDAENSLAGRANVNRLVLLLIENPEHLRNMFASCRSCSSLSCNALAGVVSPLLTVVVLCV